jgi:hypothetical protein
MNWTIENFGTHSFVTNEDDAIEITITGENHADIATLVAAAPDLLDALEELADCAGLTWLAGYKQELDDAMIRARSALAKAGR